MKQNGHTVNLASNSSGTTSMENVRICAGKKTITFRYMYMEGKVNYKLGIAATEAYLYCLSRYCSSTENRKAEKYFTRWLFAATNSLATATSLRASVLSEVNIE